MPKIHSMTRKQVREQRFAKVGRKIKATAPARAAKVSNRRNTVKEGLMAFLREDTRVRQKSKYNPEAERKAAVARGRAAIDKSYAYFLSDPEKGLEEYRMRSQTPKTRDRYALEDDVGAWKSGRAPDMSVRHTPLSFLERGDQQNLIMALGGKRV